VTVASTKPVLVVKSDDVKPGTDKRKLFQRILVPLDGSPAGESALVFTEELAAIMGSELILFHAVQPAASWMDAGIGGTYAAIEVPESVKSAAKRYMEDVQKRLLGKGLKTKIVLRDGPAAELIIEYAKNEGVDAISISTHGRTGINRWVFGSVTEKILRYGPSSVLVIRAAKGSA
jgi:nucleotide-binding universal stress UspA family protein